MPLLQSFEKAARKFENEAVVRQLAPMTLPKDSAKEGADTATQQESLAKTSTTEDVASVGEKPSVDSGGSHQERQIGNSVPINAKSSQWLLRMAGDAAPSVKKLHSKGANSEHDIGTSREKVNIPLECAECQV